MIRRMAAQARVELVLTVRNGENLLAMVAIPMGTLVLFSRVDVLPAAAGRPVDFLVPGVLALAVVASGMVTLAIATGFERQNGVLKRLGVTPLGRVGLLAAKAVSVLALVTLQSIAIAAAGFALGWRPQGGALTAAVLLSLGTAAFASIGFLLAGTLRAEGNLAVANGLFLVFMVLGGVIVPVRSLPAPARTVARALPVDALSGSLRDAFAGTPVRPASVLLLAAWAAGAAVLASATFRWD